MKSSDTHQTVIRIARTISETLKPILFTVLNDKYLEFAYSWFCNTQYMNIHKQVLVVTTHEPSLERVTKYWPDINIVFLNNTELQGHLNYSHVGYVRIMVERTVLFMSMILEGFEVFLIEMDCLWLENVLNHLPKTTNIGSIFKQCI